MISSHQIVDLIEKERSKETDMTVITAYQKLIDRIGVLEDLDMNRSNNDRYMPYNRTVSDTPLTREEAIMEFDRLFRHG